MAEATTRIEQVRALCRAGEVAAAYDLAQQWLAAARTSNEGGQVAESLIALAHVYFRQGQYQRARLLLLEAQQHVPEENLLQIEALIHLGMCAAETNAPEKAESYYRQAVDLSRLLGYDEALYRGLHALAVGIYIPRGQFGLALATDQDAYDFIVARGKSELGWTALASMGWVYWVMGQPQKAAHMAEQLQLVAPVGSLPRGFYDALMADLALDEGRMKEAQSLYDQARFIALLTGDPGLIALVWLGLSRLNRHLGRVSEAWNWADEVLSLAERVRYVHLAGMALLERARASWAAERMDASESDLKQAIALMDPLRFEYHLAQAWLLLAGLRQHMGRDSMEAWKQASMRIRRGRYAFLLEQERHLALPLIMRYRQEKDVDARHEAADMLRRLTTAAPPPLRIHSLGRFEVWQGPRRIADSAWNRRQAGALFRMLLISPWRTRTREQIIEALWPDLAIQTAYLSLHQATSALRRTLEPDLPRGFPSRYLEVASDCVTLHLPAGSWVEHEAFVALVQQEQWDEALTLYRGKLYPMEPYAEWAAWERERLSRYFLRALLGAAREALSQSRPDDALILARQALLLEPWQEQATRLGMEACLEMGDRAGALRLYQSLAKRLRDELSIVPGEELQAFYHRLATE